MSIYTMLHLVSHNFTKIDIVVVVLCVLGGLSERSNLSLRVKVYSPI